MAAWQAVEKVALNFEGNVLSWIQDFHLHWVKGSLTVRPGGKIMLSFVNTAPLSSPFALPLCVPTYEWEFPFSHISPAFGGVLVLGFGYSWLYYIVVFH